MEPFFLSPLYKGISDVVEIMIDGRGAPALSNGNAVLIYLDALVVRFKFVFSTVVFPTPLTRRHKHRIVLKKFTPIISPLLKENDTCLREVAPVG